LDNRINIKTQPNSSANTKIIPIISFTTSNPTIEKAKKQQIPGFG
jgi:chloramphenicol O-acetyltransferase